MGNLENLQTALNNVNHAVGMMNSGSALLANAQQEALKQVSVLAQDWNKIKAELEEKNAKIKELEEALKRRESVNG